MPVAEREVDVGLVDDDDRLLGGVGQLAQLVDGDQRRRRVVGVGEDDHLRALLGELVRQLPAPARLPERHSDELRALDRGERVVEAVGRPRAGDALARVQERAVEDGEAVVGAVAGQDLLDGDAVARGRGLAQPERDGVGVKAQRFVGDARQRRHHARRGRVRALVGVQLDGVGDLLAGRVAAHGADRGAHEREGPLGVGLST